MDALAWPEDGLRPSAYNIDMCASPVVCSGCVCDASLCMRRMTYPMRVASGGFVILVHAGVQRMIRKGREAANSTQCISPAYMQHASTTAMQSVFLQPSTTVAGSEMATWPCSRHDIRPGCSCNRCSPRQACHLTRWLPDKPHRGSYLVTAVPQLLAPCCRNRRSAAACSMLACTWEVTKRGVHPARCIALSTNMPWKRVRARWPQQL